MPTHGKRKLRIFIDIMRIINSSTLCDYLSLISTPLIVHKNFGFIDLSCVREREKEACSVHSMDIQETTKVFYLHA